MSSNDEVLQVGSIQERNRPTSGLSLNSANRKYTLKWYSWVVKIRNTSEAQYSVQNTLLGHHGPMGLGQYNSIGEYCGPHTASSVFLISIFTYSQHVFRIIEGMSREGGGHLIKSTKWAPAAKGPH